MRLFKFAATGMRDFDERQHQEACERLGLLGWFTWLSTMAGCEEYALTLAPALSAAIRSTEMGSLNAFLAASLVATANTL